MPQDPVRAARTQPRPMSQSTLVGVDFGKRRDYSALVILERLAAEAGGMYQPGRIWPPSRPWTPATYVCHQLHRWPLGTAYPSVVQDVQAVLASGRLPPPVTCLVDGSGPGIAVLDLFGMGVTRPAPIGIVVTNGYETTRKRPNEWHTPKSSLVIHLQAAAEARPPRLILGPRLPFFEAVKAEMESFSAETNPATGYTKYEAERRPDSHDDLLFALGLCIWWGERFGDSNWSVNVDISRALDGGLVRHKRLPGQRQRVWAEDEPPEAPLDTLSWDALKTRVGEGSLRLGGPWRPERA